MKQNRLFNISIIVDEYNNTNVEVYENSNIKNICDEKANKYNLDEETKNKLFNILSLKRDEISFNKEMYPDMSNELIVENIKQLSYLKYGRPREEVEDEIMAKYKSS